MDLNTKYEDLGEREQGKKAGVEKTVSKDPNANVGSGPVTDIADGGTEGEAKQPKEHTGNLTDMGGDTGGTPGLPDASEGNDNTSTAG